MKYSKKVFEAVNAQFEQKRNDAQSQSLLRRKELNACNPRLLQIENELARITTELLGDIASGKDGESVANRASAKSLSLQKERFEILEHMGYSGDYLSIPFDCENCGDMGFNGINMCECYARALRNEAHKTFNLAIHMPNATFLSFDLSMYSNRHIPSRERDETPRENAEGVLLACRRFVKNFKEPGDSLFITGEPGLGKTHLSSAIAHELIDAGYDIVYETAGTIFSLMEDIRFGRASEDTAARVERVSHCDLLIMDDLGAEFVTPFVRSALFSIVNGRIMNNKKTIISTNLNEEDIENIYDARIISRIFGKYKVLELYGKDVRRVLSGEMP